MADLGTMIATLGMTTKGIQAAQRVMVQTLNQINTRLDQTNAKLNNLGGTAGANLASGMRRVNQAIVPAQNSMEKFTTTLAMNSQRLRTFGYLATSTVTVPLVMLGRTALNTAKDFDFALAKIRGLVGATAEEVAGFKEQILQLAPAVGQTPLKLAETLYYVTSAGFKEGAEAMKIVNTAAKASRAGLGETEDIAKLLVFSMNAYKSSGIGAARVADVFVAAVREGAIEAEGFATAMQSVLPIASALGIGIEQVAGTMAAMSLQGASAANAATYLRGIMNSLLKIKPGSGAWKALDKLGISANQLMTDLQKPNGLMNVLMQLKEISNKDAGNIFLKQIFRDVRAMTGALSLTGQNAENVQKVLDEVAGAYGDLGRAGAAVTDEIKTKMDQLKATTSKAMGILGEGISKTLLPLFEKLVKMLNNIVNWFDSLSEGSKKVVVWFGLIAAALGPLSLLLSLFGYLLTGILQAIPILSGAMAGLAVAAPWILLVTAIIAGGTALLNYKKKVTEAATANSVLNKELVQVNDELKKLKDLTDTDLSSMTGVQLWNARDSANKAYQEARNQAIDFAKKGGLTEAELFSGVRPKDKMNLWEKLFGTDYTKILDQWVISANEAKDMYASLDSSFNKWTDNFGKGSGALAANTGDIEDNVVAIEKEDSALKKLMKQYQEETKYLDMINRMSQGGKRFDFDFDTAKLDLAESTLKDFIKEMSKLGDPSLLGLLGGPLGGMIGSSLNAVLEGLIYQVQKYKKAISDRAELEQLRLLQMEANAFGGLAGKIEVFSWELQAAERHLKDLFKARIGGKIIPDEEIKKAVDNIRMFKYAIVDLENASDLQFLEEMWTAQRSAANGSALLSGRISALEKSLRSMSEAGQGAGYAFKRLAEELQNLRYMQDVSDILTSSFNSLFDALIDGTKNWGQTFEDIGKAILRTLANIIAQMLVMRIIMAIIGGMSGLSGLSPVGTGNITMPTLAPKLPGLQGPPRFAQGGIVPPGYPNDSYNARLSSGEAVIPLEKYGIGEQTVQLDADLRFVIEGDNLVAIFKKKMKKNSIY